MATERQVGFSRVALRLMLAAGAAALLAGCSDASRFASDPFSDPFGNPPAATSRSARTVDRSSTGSISGSPNYSPVQSRPLAAPSKNASSSNATPVASAAPAPAASSGSYNHWSAEGGTPITVGAGETTPILANRYGVPTDVLLKVNGFSSSAQVQPGSRLVIPVYRATAANARSEPEAHPAKEARAEAKPTPKHVAAKADAEEDDARAPKASQKGARSLAAKPGKLAKSDERDGEKAAPSKSPEKKAKTPDKKAKVAAKSDDEEDEKPAVKGKVQPAKAKPAKTVAKADDDVTQKPAPKPKAQSKLAKAGPVTEPVETPAPVKSGAKADKREQAKVAVNDPPAERAPAPERKVDKTTTTAAIAPAAVEKPSDAAHPEFRWPARGRIIQGFANGGNDGINISVPEGTQVKAAESGVVAYAGSELKGYGNLVLIRHPNGFVTAYAHNGDITVKRGDQVTRGQTIAKSGQSGNVSSPQLHFELRKGSTPVDPTNYLAGL
ncbi:MAG: peptidoglycan DD-metalloendopeptidase family protein [Methylocystis sp.]